MKKNSQILLIVLCAGLLLGLTSCYQEPAADDGETFYAFYPEIEPMMVTGVAPTCDGFFVLGYHPDVRPDVPGSVFLVRVDGNGNMIRTWNHRLSATIVGTPTNLLVAPSGDMYFAARQKIIAGTEGAVPTVFRIQRNPLTCEYSMSSWSISDSGRWLVPPAAPITEPYANIKTSAISLAWDTAARQLLIYSVRNYSQGFESDSAAICISAMDPDGQIDSTKKMRLEIGAENYYPPKYATDNRFTPFFVKTNRYLYLSSLDVDDQGLSKNSLWMVCWDKADSMYGKISQPWNSTFLNLFGIMPVNDGDGVKDFFDSARFVIQNEQYYLLCREESDIEPRLVLKKQDAGLTSDEMVMRTQRFGNGNNVLLRPISNNRYMLAASNRDGGMRLKILTVQGDHVREDLSTNVLSGGDYAPLAITEASNGDIIVAGSTLTFDRTSTLFLLRVDSKTLTFSRDSQ